MGFSTGAFVLGLHSMQAQQLKSSIAQMTDAELICAVEHPEDHTAAEVGFMLLELERRSIPADELRPRSEIAFRWIAHKDERESADVRLLVRHGLMLIWGALLVELILTRQ